MTNAPTFTIASAIDTASASDIVTGTSSMRRHFVILECFFCQSRKNTLGRETVCHASGPRAHRHAMHSPLAQTHATQQPFRVFAATIRRLQLVHPHVMSRHVQEAGLFMHSARVGLGPAFTNAFATLNAQLQSCRSLALCDHAILATQACAFAPVSREAPRIEALLTELPRTGPVAGEQFGVLV